MGGQINIDNLTLLKHRVLLFLLLLVIGRGTRAQDFAIQNNVLSDALGNISLGAEFALRPRTTVELYGGIRPWKSSGDKVNKYWFAESQYRFWTCQKYNGLFYGPYVYGAQFNVGNTTPFLGIPTTTKDHRYEGWLIGAGIGAGYEYPISLHWNIGAEIGVGYTYLNYKKFECGTCGNLDSKEQEHNVGISKLGINIIYLF